MGYAKHEIKVMRAAGELLKNGKSIRAVARELGVSPSTVSRWGAAAGISSDPSPAEIQTIKTGDPIQAALSIGPNANERTWATFGRSHTIDEIDPEQSARLFESVAFGLPFPQCFEAAGLPGGNAETFESRYRQRVEPWATYWAAVKICRSWVLIRATKRVSEGLAGWQGAARLLAAIAPDFWGDDPGKRESYGFELVDENLIRQIVDMDYEQRHGIKPKYDSLENPVVLPLSATGMDDNPDAPADSVQN